jgi:prophage regulatory protein
MTGRLLKIGEVIAETSLSRPTIYRAIGRGEFPNRIKLSPRRVGWAQADIDAWKSAQRALLGGIAGGTDQNPN